MFVDNAGADVILGMLPFARELLRLGSEVVLVANSLPAINDITAAELRSVVAKAADYCPIIRAARDAAVASQAANDGRVPPLPGLSARIASHDKLHSMDGSGSSSGSGRNSSEGSFNDKTRGTAVDNAGTASSNLHEGLRRLHIVNEVEGGEGSGSSRKVGVDSPGVTPRKGMFGESYPTRWRDPR